MQPDTQAYVKWFRNSSSYINAHRGKTFVVAFPGEAVDHPNFHHVIQDIVLMHSLGIHMVLVHGARSQIDQQLSRYGLPIHIENHRRVTDQASLAAVQEAIGRTYIQVQAHLTQGMAAAHLQGHKALVNSGNYVVAKPYGVHNGIDYQHSGAIRKINSQPLQESLQQGGLSLISPLGYSPTGEVFNLLWEEVAAATAVALQADKVIYLDQEAGILDDNSALIKELTVPQAQQHMASLAQPNFSLQCATESVSQGVPRAHIISYPQDGALLQELFTVDGNGTLITQQNYEKVRLANIEDVASVLELIEPMEAEGVLVRRSRELLETEIEHFTLIERDDKVIACAALYPFSEQQSGELACVTVHPDYRHGQRGDILLKAIEQRASMLGLKTLFVLTTQTAHWFMERGFKSAAITELPQHKQSLYNYQRNSKVFIKSLERQA